MNLSELDLLFWAREFFVANLVLLFVLFFRGRFRNFPIFTALITLNVARTIALFFIRRHNAQSAYFYTFWTLAVVDVGLQFGIVYEVSSKVFRPMGRWVPDLKKISSKWGDCDRCLHFLPDIDTETTQRFPDAGNNRQEQLPFGGPDERVICSGCWRSQRLRGSPGRAMSQELRKGSRPTLLQRSFWKQRNTCLGLGGSGPLYDDLSRIRIGIYLCCVTYWIVALWRKCATFQGYTGSHSSASRNDQPGSETSS